MNVEEWASVLKLSTMWDFSETRKQAIARLSTSRMDLLTRVILARQYKVPGWLFSGYEGLVKRKEGITEDEAERLGLSTAIRLYRIREECIAKYPIRRHRDSAFGGGGGGFGFAGPVNASPRFGNPGGPSVFASGGTQNSVFNPHGLIPDLRQFDDPDVGSIDRAGHSCAAEIRREFAEELRDVEQLMIE